MDIHTCMKCMQNTILLVMECLASPEHVWMPTFWIETRPMALKEMTSFPNEQLLLPSETELPWAYTYLLPNKAIEKGRRHRICFEREGYLLPAVILGQIFNELLILRNVHCPFNKEMDD